MITRFGNIFAGNVDIDNIGLEGAIDAGAWLCGPADQITEKLKDIEARYPGLEFVNVQQVIGTPQSVILEQLERFSEEVMPAFKN